MEEFSAKGFAGARVSEIAARAGERRRPAGPAALLLIGMSAANALAVYPQLARRVRRGCPLAMVFGSLSPRAGG